LQPTQDMESGDEVDEDYLPSAASDTASTSLATHSSASTLRSSGTTQESLVSSSIHDFSVTSVDPLGDSDIDSILDSIG
jgi:hypothetical protein